MVVLDVDSRGVDGSELALRWRKSGETMTGCSQRSVQESDGLTTVSSKRARYL